ncbi:type-F conjugative transfer system protein TraW [Iodidimonas gelatinilytica]|uniref:Type-F conjugative transfer system protein TraW n=1 Tax=Iodidimonas gelatinilytica TaxID=1236966 RepID=A0A5A7MUA3_9PROT|nr:type-F conjugative transfer system protein TraW [Iodidimonas gelatinilytica]
MRGHTWEIIETDLLAHLKAKASAFAGNGGLDAWQKDAERRVRSYVETPPPVSGIAPALEDRSRLFDPSIRVAKDIQDDKGRLIAKAGTLINPLDYVTLSKDLLFVDGRDEAQVTWALGIKRPAKIVLVAGPVLALMREHKRPLYFDQKGLLARRFQIAAVPASVSQDGRRLRIREFPLSKKTGKDAR